MMRFTAIVLLALAGLIAVDQAPAHAQDGGFYPSWFANPRADCYIKRYTSSHLKHHPAQSVEVIAFKGRARNPDGSENWEPKFGVSLGVKRKNERAWYMAYMTCSGGDVGGGCSLSNGDHISLGPEYVGDRLFLSASTGKFDLRSRTSTMTLGTGEDNNFRLERRPNSECTRIFGRLR